MDATPALYHYHGINTWHRACKECGTAMGVIYVHMSRTRFSDYTLSPGLRVSVDVAEVALS